MGLGTPQSSSSLLELSFFTIRLCWRLNLRALMLRREREGWAGFALSPVWRGPYVVPQTESGSL